MHVCDTRSFSAISRVVLWRSESIIALIRSSSTSPEIRNYLVANPIISRVQSLWTLHWLSSPEISSSPRVTASNPPVERDIIGEITSVQAFSLSFQRKKASFDKIENIIHSSLIQGAVIIHHRGREGKSVRWIRGWKMQLQQTTSAIFSGWWFTTPGRISCVCSPMRRLFRIHYACIFIWEFVRKGAKSELRRGCCSPSPLVTCNERGRRREKRWLDVSLKAREGLDGWWGFRLTIMENTKDQLLFLIFRLFNSSKNSKFKIANFNIA